MPWHGERYEPSTSFKQSKLQRVRRHFFAIWQRRWKPGIAIEDCELVCDAECHVQNSPQVNQGWSSRLANGTSKLHPSNFNFINICNMLALHLPDSRLYFPQYKPLSWQHLARRKLEKKGVGHLQPCMCVDQQSNGLRFKFTSSTESLIS